MQRYKNKGDFYKLLCDGFEKFVRQIAASLVSHGMQPKHIDQSDLQRMPI